MTYSISPQQPNLPEGVEMPLTPDEIAGKSFPSVLRGYAKWEVDEFLKDVALDYQRALGLAEWAMQRSVGATVAAPAVPTVETPRRIERSGLPLDQVAAAVAAANARNDLAQARAAEVRAATPMPEPTPTAHYRPPTPLPTPVGAMHTPTASAPSPLTDAPAPQPTSPLAAPSPVTPAPLGASPVASTPVAPAPMSSGRDVVAEPQVDRLSEHIRYLAILVSNLSQRLESIETRAAVATPLSFPAGQATMPPPAAPAEVTAPVRAEVTPNSWWPAESPLWVVTRHNGSGSGAGPGATRAEAFS